jgi:hypothetical protein
MLTAIALFAGIFVFIFVWVFMEYHLWARLESVIKRSE